MRFSKTQWRPSAARRRMPPRSIIDVSGFAGIMFVLVFLFLEMTAPLDRPMHSFATDLPITYYPASKPGALREDTIALMITRDGAVYFRNAKILPRDLPAAIQEAVNTGSEKTVYIRADARVKYADVKVVLERIRESGLANVTFLTEWHQP
jgi:biopolymer transport protein ExbD